MAKISAYTEQNDPTDNDYFVMVRSGVNYKIKRATVLEFTPTTPGDWGSPTPGSIQEALDTLAASAGSAVIADGDYGDIVVSGSGSVWSLDTGIDYTGKTWNNGTFDNVTVQNSILDDVVIDTTSQVDFNGLVFFVHDSGDPTKKFKFDASGIATATTRTLTVPNANGTIALTSDLSSGYQPLDSDLTTIAGLTATTDNFIQSKSSAWASRTPAQVAADLSSLIKPTESLVIACSDETTAITTGTAKVTFRMPYAFTLTAVRASVTTAPTGSTIIIDINEAGSTILSTKLSIDTSEKTSTTAASAAVISDSSLADDAEITIDFDQVGSTIAGAGVKVVLIGTRT